MKSCPLVVASLITGLTAASVALAADSFDLLAQPLDSAQPYAWKHFSESPGAKLSDVWQLRDGVLICRGTPKGYLFLDHDFTDFVLRLEWRWPEGAKPGNGGVLFRITGPDKVWPRSLEAQINAGQAGDFWAIDGFAIDGPAERKESMQHAQFGALTHLKRALDPERPAGQWNEYEIIARGPTVTLRINGREVNRATGCDVRPGRICLTAEGDEIHFRNVCLQLLPTGANHTLSFVDAPPPNPLRVWPSQPPADCPFPRSADFVGLGFTSRHAEYTGADTWYPSWAADGNLYSPWTDGTVNGLGAFSGGTNATTGHATILGDDPLHLVVTNQGVFASNPRPYEGRYPCGSLVHDGVWYYGTYCLHPSARVDRDGIPYNWPWLGPFVGFRWSTNFGKTWTQTPCTPARPLFGEHALYGEPVKIGAPHFVDFGKALEHSPDGKAYLVAQGASDGAKRRYAYNSWITADQVHLLRVTPGIANMNDAAQYEFFAGHDERNEPRWTRDLAASQPIAEWRDHMGCVTMTYDVPLKRYLLCVTDGGNTVSRFSTYILESERITGPWKLAAYLEHFGEQAYFVNIPSKFIGCGGERVFWLCYAANFSSGWGGITFQSRPRGSRYGMCLQEVRLLAPGEDALGSVLQSPENIASDAAVSVSSTHPEYSADALNDGAVGGYPDYPGREWCTRGEHDTATVRLTWNSEQRIDRVWLFDRPNPLDQVKSGLLIFSDGSTIRTGELPDDGKRGLEVSFAPKSVRWLIFAVDQVKPGSPNIGLAELAVFRSN